MRFEQVRDALHHVESFHRQLSAFYQSSAERKVEGKEKMLLDYMAQHEMDLSDDLKKYEDGAPNRILDGWFQYADDDNLLKFSDKAELENVEDIVAISLECGEKLISLLNDFADNADTPDLKEVFSNMAQMQAKEQRKLSMNVDRMTEL